MTAGVPPPAGPGPLLGIDVSHFQATVDWQAVARGSIAFAYAKASEGATSTDQRFAGNWQGMHQAGLPRGAYHFFRPATPAKEQADHFIALVGKLEPGDLPPMVDLEETAAQGRPEEWATVAGTARITMVLAWLEQVEAALGLKPVLYTRRGFLAQYFSDLHPLTGYLLWVADYRPLKTPALPAGWERWTFWQYSEKGKVPGITGSVDLDRFNGTHAQLLALARPAAPAVPATPAPPVVPATTADPVNAGAAGKTG